MEIDKMLKHISNLNEYISVTQEVLKMPGHSKILFNMSTVLSLKKVRALEIEYFNKCEGSGAALIFFELMVEVPPSKTWGFIGQELVMLLQYWLDAVRKHLIKHNHNWWSFTKIILKFIKFIRLKEPSLPNVLVEYTAECLLDLATSSVPDVPQRLEILHCLNLISGDSNRETRSAMKNKLEPYFVKLSTFLAASGHLPIQFGMVETLMRWLVPRHEQAVRRSAAAKWFPEAVYGGTAVQMFLERAWQNFFKDARDFLNAYNETSELVVSIVCRKANIGNTILASGSENKTTFLDLNCSDKSVSILVDPRNLESLGIRVDWVESLILTDENIQHVQLSKESSELTLSVHTTLAPRLYPSGMEVGAACELRAVVSSKDVDKLDRTLRRNYSSRYKLLLDLFKITHSLSPQDIDTKTRGSADDDTRFSHPVQAQRRSKHSGYVVRSRNPAWKSPSTASTSSLAQLHEKLALLPRYKFEKEAVHVCALPELSTVTETSETDDRQSFLSASTLKITRPFGVCNKSIRSEKHSQSDSEIQNKPKVGRYLSPVGKDDENSTSCLLVATVGSDESVINDTLERFNKNKHFHGDNIVDLLVKEALQRDYQEKDKLLDSGINTGDNRKTQEQEENSEAIENTPVENVLTVPKKKQDNEKTCTVISNTTTDESNDVVNDTPLNFVNVRKRQKHIIVQESTKDDADERPPEFDVQVVETFFSQHLNENKRGEIVISPTLARKINETSSDSEQFDDCLLNDNNNIQVDRLEIQDIDIIECLNSMVDKVCSDLERCTEILGNEFRDIDTIDNVNAEDQPQCYTPLKDTTNIERLTLNKEENEGLKSVVTKKAVKLTFPTKKTARARANAKRKNIKLEMETVPKTSPIIKTRKTVNEIPTKVTTPERDSPTDKSDQLDVPLIRRKRKLYSPKDENKKHVLNTQYEQIEMEEIDNDFKTSKVRTPETTTHKATCYKDIEEDRQKRLRQPRTRKSRSKSERTPSPRTKNMNDIFDHLKDKVESNVSIILADKKQERDLAMYNFTSDSEDEDFKKKKVEIHKRFSSTTIASMDSSMSTRHGRTVNRVNYSESKSSDEAKKKIVLKPKRNMRSKKQTKTRQIKKEKNLIDERMRKATTEEELNTSLVLEKPIHRSSEGPMPVLRERLEMEDIPDETVIEIKELNEVDKKKSKKADALSLKNKKTKLKAKPTELSNDDRTESPLPGLLVETIPTKVVDINDSISIKMLQKIQKIYQEGPETSYNDTNNTQNLLSDVERTNFSPPPMNLTTDEFDKIVNYDLMVDNTTKKINQRVLRTSKFKDNETVIQKEVTETSKRKSKAMKIKEEHPKAKTQKAKEDIEIIEISGISEVKSDKSIATVGKSPITAHGDSNEAPPDTEDLTQHFRQRDLEIQDLDQSTRDYFNKLRNEIIDLPAMRHESNSSDATRKIHKDRYSSSKEKSPVVSVYRLSIDDISKWLPSRRNSDTDSSCSAQKSEPSNHPKAAIKTKDSSEKYLRKSKPVVEKLEETCLQIHPQDDRKSKHTVSEYKSHRRTRKVSNHEDSDSYKSVKSIEPAKVKKTYKRQKPNQEEGLDDDQLNTSKWLRSLNTPEIQDRSLSQIKETTKTPKKKNKDTSQTQKRQSIISPIKLFEEMSKYRRDSSTGDEDSQHNVNKNIKSNNSRQELNTSKISKDNNEMSSTDSKMSTSTRLDCKNRLKRKSLSPVQEFSKIRRLENAEIVLSESGPSISSVNEWFRRNVPVKTVDNVNAALRETVQNVMEKLDTTLAEIHQDTSKRFIHMFVHAQKHLTSVQQERRQMFRTVASEILGDVVKVIDAKFADLDQRSQVMDSEFMEQLKSQASQLIREDCKKKQVMVTLLREDVQAVLDHMAKARRDNC